MNLPAWLTAAANRADAEQPPQPAPSNPAVVAAVAEAKSAAEWLEAQYVWCPAKGCGRMLADANGERNLCGPGCEKRRGMVA